MRIPKFREFAKISMVTSSAPIYRADGSLLGVATADIDLTQMQQMILSLEVFAQGEAFLIDQSGVYIAHKDSEKLLSANIQDDSNASFAALGRQIMSQQEGLATYEADGQTYYAWFDQIPESGWYVVVTASQQNLLASANNLGRTLALICVAFILIIFLILVFYLGRSVIRPIRELEAVTSKIADGDLNVHISHQSKSEFSHVSHSLEKMVTRLKLYIAYIEEISGVLLRMAKGDFGFELHQDYSGEFQPVKEGLLHTRDNITDILQGISAAADQVNTGAEQVSTGSQVLSQGSVEQAHSVEELSSSAQDILEKVQENAANAKTADQEVGITKTHIQQSQQKMEQLMATETASTLSQAAQDVVSVVDTIQQITLASSEQAQVMAQVSQSLEQVSGVVQTNSATAQESAAASQELSAQAMVLNNLIGRFQIPQGLSQAPDLPPQPEAPSPFAQFGAGGKY